MNNITSIASTDINKLSLNIFDNEALQDYYIACVSREASLLGRREMPPAIF